MTLENTTPPIFCINYSPVAPQQPVIFLDRDGIINIDTGYTHKIEDFQFVPGILDAARAWEAAGYAIIIVTNQSGIGRGYYTDTDFRHLTEWMISEFKKESITIRAVYYCPHPPQVKCECRKPSPGMLTEAIKTHTLNPEQCWMIGDKLSDIEAGIAAGIHNTVLIGEADPSALPKFQVRSISEIQIPPHPALRAPLSTP